MKFQFFTFMWFNFLSNEDKDYFKQNVRSKTFDTSLLLNNFVKPTSDEEMINYLYKTMLTCFYNISHRRSQFVSITPKSKIDMLYLLFIENKRSVQDLTYLQRIILERLVFKIKDNLVTYEDRDITTIPNPIYLDVGV